MKENSYISVLQFQLRLKVECTNIKDILNVDDEYYEQMDKAIELIREFKPDICIFPEMAFTEKYSKAILEFSENNRLIVFGSNYVENVNKTKVFYNGNFYEIIKRYPCGSEPMVRFYEKISIDEFIKEYLDEHKFIVKESTVYVLNCLEYYQVAYFIARNEELTQDLFGFIVPCSNSNPNVFMEETRAIHNHNENIYSFVCNRIKEDGTKGYGRSYVYGPIQAHEKEWLMLDGIKAENHNASILTLDSKTPSYSYGRYANFNKLSRFGRSDCYINTPILVKIGNLI